MDSSQLVEEIARLKRLLEEKDKELLANTAQNQTRSLSKDEIVRFSRQIILPEVGVSGQLRLKTAAVLIVGAGGLGCPAATYLAGAGVGRLGIVDYDLVELNNLHRQLLHTESSLGTPKVDSIKTAIERLNSSILVEPYNVQLTSANALELFEKYDIVIDASDNPATRYLINDACVLTGKPLVSGGALGMEGQLTIYNHKAGPCYRCVFPKPAPPESVSNCSDNGVLGAVTGVIGALQALEAIKLIVNTEETINGSLLMFDGAQSSFRKVKLRQRRENCEVCSASATIHQLVDYEQFCGMKATDKGTEISVLNPDERISATDLAKVKNDEKEKLVLIDVRIPVEFEMCHISGSINIPMKDLTQQNCSAVFSRINTNDVYVICRRGNDSQLAVKTLKELSYWTAYQFKDVKGGLHAWSRDVDSQFPIY